jgi:predicted MPP superfamily phosphohydrolase
MVPPLEEMGIHLLMNESVLLRRGGSTLCLAGVDDPHFYEADNVQKAAAQLEPGMPSVLLAHTPEIYRKAAACGFGLVLCGHTHGGQICLPGGIPLFINARVPLRMVRRGWQYRGLQGYTSVGTGSSGVDVRFWCPPEVTLHTLGSTPDPSVS